MAKSDLILIYFQDKTEPRMSSVKETPTYFTAWMLDGADIKWDVIKWDCTWGRFKEEHGSLVWVDYLTSKWEMCNGLSGVKEESLD